MWCAYSFEKQRKPYDRLLILFESFHTVSSSLSYRDLYLYAISWPTELLCFIDNLKPGLKAQIFAISVYWFQFNPQISTEQKVPSFGGFCDLKEIHYATYGTLVIYSSTHEVRPAFAEISNPHVYWTYMQRFWRQIWNPYYGCPTHKPLLHNQEK